MTEQERAIFSREALLLGDEALPALSRCRVAVFGIGGVGGYAAEALARAGIGALDLIDGDTVSVSNINRQIIATLDTVGRYKTEAMAERIARISPGCRVTCRTIFYLPETAEDIQLTEDDCVLDAVDTVRAKVELAVRCAALGVPLISAMGAGNKLDPSKFVITDITKTHTCPLARVMRRELKKRGVEHLRVCYSTETPRPPMNAEGGHSRVPGSISFVPGVAGLMLAGEALRVLLERKLEDVED